MYATYFRHLFSTLLDLTVEATLRKNLLTPVPKWTNGQ